MMRLVFAFLCAGVVVIAGCERDQPKGAGVPDTVFGDVPDYGQVPGKGRIDRGGGATAGGVPPDSRTNYTKPGTGLEREPRQRDLVPGQ